MSDKEKKLEQIIEQTLLEAKKKARMKAHSKSHDEEGEEKEEDEKEVKHSKKKVEEARHEEEDTDKMKKMKKMKKMEEAKDEEDDEEEEDVKSSKKKMKVEEDIEESTQAAESLKPSSRPKDEPKSVVMGNMMKMAGGMSKDDLNKFAATMAQFGPGKDYGVGDKSASNQATIDMKTGKGPKTKDAMPKLNVKEDIDEMFVGEDLSEEFKEKASTLFEAAVSARLAVEVAKLEEAYQETIAEELEVFTEEITDKLDAYLDYVVENWMAENEVAIESTLRNEIMEEFIDGLKGLFSEHYIEVPESKVDVVESLAEKVNELEETLDNVITENSEMKEIISDVAMREIFEELSSDLALTQQEKFASLAEGIEFDGDIDVYTKKLRIIKETYFNNEQVSSNLEEETFEGDNPSVVSTNPVVNKYVQALSRTVKK